MPGIYLRDETDFSYLDVEPSGAAGDRRLVFCSGLQGKSRGWEVELTEVQVQELMGYMARWAGEGV